MTPGQRAREATETLSELIKKHGFSTVVALGSFVIIVVFLLQPQAKERQLLLQTITKSVEDNSKTNDSVQQSMETIAKSTQAIVSSTQKMQVIVAESKIQQTIDNSKRLAGEEQMQTTIGKLNDTLTKFSGEVREVHPKMQKKLDCIEEGIKGLKLKDG